MTNTNMTTIHNERVIPCDIDDTLVMHKYNKDAIPIKCPYTQDDLFLLPNQPMIRLVREEQARGSCILFWSRGGYKWAKAVVETLQLMHPGSIVMSKPVTYFDDKPVTDWLVDRVYLEPTKFYKK